MHQVVRFAHWDAPYVAPLMQTLDFKMSYTIHDSTLVLDNGKKVSFKYPISDVVLANEVLVVMLNVPSTKIFNENVYGVSRQGKILWQVEKTASVSNNNPYVGIHITPSMQKHGEKFIKLNKWDGVTNEIRPETGKILSSRFTK